MGVKRYTANKDNTITNAFQSNLTTRGTGSNMGASDILEVFSLYGQGNTTSSAELSRVLLEFPITKIAADRTNGDIPASGSVSFYLRVYNARHSEQLPRDFTVNVLAVSQSWQEGHGLDMEGYTDVTEDAIVGSNWIRRSKTDSWAQIGGTYHSSTYAPGTTMPNYTFTFEDGDEDIFLDVTAAVEEWIAGNQANYGFGIFLTSSFSALVTASDSFVLANTAGQKTSFYTKRFFSRTSEFFFKKPNIEARWDSRRLDNRGSFFYSSSLAPAEDNLNTIYLYNYVRGRLTNIPSVGTGTILVSIYSGSTDDTAPFGPKLQPSRNDKASGVGFTGDTNNLNITGGFVATGIYSCSFAFTGSTSLKTLYDVWHTGSTEFFTGAIKPETLTSPGWNNYPRYATKITNLKPLYVSNEQARFRVFTRARKSSQTIYSIASLDPENTIIQSASYEIIRMVDNATVINNSTGSSTYHTYLSYDNSGSYFDLDMSLLEPGYLYGIKLAYYTSVGWREQEEVFKFRVEDN